MVGIREIKKVRTYEDLENLGIGNVYCDIGSRGGGVGLFSSDVANEFGVSEGHLPPKFGAGCNYLGGGIRGSIFASDFDKKITGRRARLLSELGEACCRVYGDIENENRMNDEEDEDGETNWDAKATKNARKNGVVSAY